MENYYNDNAKKYIEDTVNCDMSEQYSLFLKYYKKKGKILDIGFGSGRDMIYFSSLGNEVHGIDSSIAFVNNMKDKGYNVECIHAEDIDYIDEFDGIWACASLLHVDKNNLKDVLTKCYKALKNGGVFYLSFKYGEFSGIKNDRYFHYLNEISLSYYLKGLDFKINEISITDDVRANRDNEKWLNVVLTKY